MKTPRQTTLPTIPASALCLALAFCLMPAQAATTPDSASPASGTVQSPWSFNLTLYAWFAGVNGTYGVGRLSKSVDASFIDIANKLKSVPIAFMGRFETHYERFGLYLDSDYMNLDFKNQSGRRGFADVGLSTQLGILDYGGMYRVAGPSPSDHANWEGKTLTNRLDLYVGGRTVWLDTTIYPSRIPKSSSSVSLTAPLLGGRIGVDFTPEWFLLMDVNGGGFGVDNISFTGSALGMVGYRTAVFDVPGSVELGYKALRVDAKSGRMETRTTLNGPFLGYTAYW